MLAPENITTAAAANLPAGNLKVEKVCRSCRRNRQGAAVVEFAIVAPVFITLVLGMIEVGRGVMVQQVLTNASREGARFGVLDGATGADVTTKVKDYITRANINSAAATVTVNPSDPSSAPYGGQVQVTVSIPYASVSWVPVPRFLASQPLSASSSMRRESVQ